MQAVLEAFADDPAAGRRILAALAHLRAKNAEGVGMFFEPDGPTEDLRHIRRLLSAAALLLPAMVEELQGVDQATNTTSTLLGELLLTISDLLDSLAGSDSEQWLNDAISTFALAEAQSEGV